MIRRRSQLAPSLGPLAPSPRGRAPARIALPLIAALTLGAWPAAAQTDEERAAARSLAEQGFSAYNAENWREALDRFERAESLMHAPPHLLYAARASAKLGGFVKARELYNKILREDLPATAPAAFRDAKRDAAAELPEVEKKIAYLTIQIAGAPAGSAEVKLDGALVPSALIGVERPVDPGTRQITVSAAGFEPATQEITLEEAGRESIEITLTPAAGGDVTPPGGEEPGEGFSGSTDDIDTSGMSPMRLGAFISLGVGVVGLGLGALFMIQAGGTQSDSDKLFDDPANGCSRRTPLNPAACNESDSLNDDAAGQRSLGAVGLIVGGAAVATGVVLFILSGKEKQAASGPSVTPWVGLNSLGVSGTF
ncbi:MAG: PEGA domain-containing protein [Polyangiaceae bacterium]|nr:PEGA domain-containing protein [Polyangiaceae bacterium]MCW5790546.1 PEGA domain-containing protein [Polyangiaceae bacterium]